MLELKIEIEDLDKTGSVITVRDATGEYDPVDNPTGYGTPNLSKSNVEGLVYTLSPYSSRRVYTAIAERNPGGLPPDPCMIYMDIDDVMDGEPVQLSSPMFYKNNPEEGTYAFPDGVHDLNYHAYVTPIYVEGKKGDIYVEGSSLIPAQLLDYDSILLGCRIYTIDKSKPVGDGSIMFITEPLHEDVTEARLAYRANAKVINNRGSRRFLAKNSALLIEDRNLSRFKESQRKIFMMKHAIDASFLDILEYDYKGADEKLRYSYKLGYSLWGLENFQ